MKELQINKEEMDTFDDKGYGIARIRIEKSDNNYNYIIWCGETAECAVIDPLDSKPLIDFVREKSLVVRYVINTHAHPDHIAGNNSIVSATDVKILIHGKGLQFVSKKSELLEDGDEIDLGRKQIKVIHTPGHCPEHVSVVFGENVFVGDTLFLSGCGNTRYGGNVDELYESIAFKLRNLPEGYRMFVGHNYAETNLRFSLTIEQSNQPARRKLDEVMSAKSQGKEPHPTTIGEEKKYNPFLRFDVPELIAELNKKKPSISYDQKEIFRELREMRNNWK